jgi:hypothetical protein
MNPGDDSPLATARREVVEETGVDVLREYSGRSSSSSSSSTSSSSSSNSRVSSNQVEYLLHDSDVYGENGPPVLSIVVIAAVTEQQIATMTAGDDVSEIIPVRLSDLSRLGLFTDRQLELYRERHRTSNTQSSASAFKLFTQQSGTATKLATAALNGRQIAFDTDARALLAFIDKRQRARDQLQKQQRQHPQK